MNSITGAALTRFDNRECSSSFDAEPEFIVGALGGSFAAGAWLERSFVPGEAVVVGRCPLLVVECGATPLVSRGVALNIGGIPALPALPLLLACLDGM